MKKKQGGCETCTYFTYDEDYECYVCDIDMDEDEYVRLCQMITTVVRIIAMGMSTLLCVSRCRGKRKRGCQQNHPTQVSKRQPLTKGRISIYFYLLYLSSEGIQ